MKQAELIAELKERIVNQIERVHAFQDLPSNKLSQSSSPNSWNALQCLEHLNRYAEFYIDSIGKKTSEKKKPINKFQSLDFKPGYFGKMFCNGMLADENGSIKKMKTFKSKNPAEQDSSIESLEKFLEFQQAWLELLDSVKGLNLNSNRCSLTIPMIKMNLGSTLRFVIYHQERHLLQAEKAVRNT